MFDFQVRVQAVDGTLSPPVGVEDERGTASWRCAARDVRRAVIRLVQAVNNDFLVQFYNPTLGVCRVRGVHVMAYRGEDLLHDEVVMTGDEGDDERASLTGDIGFIEVKLAADVHMFEDVTFRVSLYYPSPQIWSELSYFSEALKSTSSAEVERRRVSSKPGRSAVLLTASSTKNVSSRGLEDADDVCQAASVGLESGTVSLSAELGPFELGVKQMFDIDLAFFPLPVVTLMAELRFAPISSGITQDMNLELRGCNVSSRAFVSAGGIIIDETDSSNRLSIRMRGPMIGVTALTLMGMVAMVLPRT